MAQSQSGKTAPRARERSLSTYLETGSVLIEAATDTEQVAATLATLAPLVSDMQYFRFNPEDERCGMELDDINPLSWSAVEAAADDYIAANDDSFDAAAKALCHNAGAGTVFEARSHRLGVRQEIVVIHALRSMGQGPAAAATAAGAVARWLWASRHVTHAASPELPPPDRQAQARGPQHQQQQRQRQLWKRQAPHSKVASVPGQPVLAAAAGATAAAKASPMAAAEALLESASLQPPQSPSVSLPAPGSCAEPAASAVSPDSALRGPAKKPRISNHVDGGTGRSAARQLSDNWGTGSESMGDEGGGSSSGQGATAADVAALAAAARTHCERVGVVHLALETHGDDLVTKWQQELVAVVDPSVQANALLAEINDVTAPAASEGEDGSDGELPRTLSAAFATHNGRAIDMANGDSVAMLGCQQQALGGSSMATSFLLLRCRPHTSVSPPQVRSMAAWRGQLVVTTSVLVPAMVAALLAGGARAVICRHPGTEEPSPEAARSFFSVLYNALLAGRTVAQVACFHLRARTNTHVSRLRHYAV